MSANWGINVGDGPVNVEYKQSSSSTRSFLKDKVMLTAISDKVLNNQVTQISENPNKEDMLTIEALNTNSYQKFLFITNRAYILARVWPLSLLSLGLISP